MKRYNVCAVTGARSDYGLLRPLLLRLREHPQIQLSLAVTGTHLDQRFGNTQEEIAADGFLDYAKIPLPLEDGSHLGMAKAAGEALSAFAAFFHEHEFDLLVLLGDRYEAFAAAAAAHLMGLPIAHISGGDVTEGAVDDALRHSITKMSTLHFPGCEQSRRRIIQMGEQPDTVFNVGEPGVENALHASLLSLADLQENLGFDLTVRPYCVVTFHPVTMEHNTAEQQMTELIAAMDSFPNLRYIITKANADAGGVAINAIWDKAAKTHPNWYVTPSLGMCRYLSALRYARLVLGNSSSGIVEAPAMHLPTVNIGDRQKGRMLAESVLSCAPERDAIAAAMTQALSPAFQCLAQTVKCPFGDGTTSEKILAELLRYLAHDPIRKTFYDVEFT